MKDLEFFALDETQLVDLLGGGGTNTGEPGEDEPEPPSP